MDPSVAEATTSPSKPAQAAPLPRGRGDTWTVVGTVTSVWAVVIGLLLAFMTDVRAWAVANSGWFVPFVLLFLLMTTSALGYLFAAVRLRGSQRPIDSWQVDARATPPLEFATIATILEREIAANEIWIVSPRLFYDVYDPTFRTVIVRNRLRGCKYRYIVPGNDEIRRNLQAFVETYRLTLEQQESDFLVLPDSKFTTFLTEMSVYDPGQSTMYAFSGPPSARAVEEDVIVFSRELSQHYAKKFSDIWLEHKGALP
jgi:hypothetical protein